MKLGKMKQVPKISTRVARIFGNLGCLNFWMQSWAHFISREWTVEDLLTKWLSLTDLQLSIPKWNWPKTIITSENVGSQCSSQGFTGHLRDWVTT